MGESSLFSMFQGFKFSVAIRISRISANVRHHFNEKTQWSVYDDFYDLNYDYIYNDVYNYTYDNLYDDNYRNTYNDVYKNIYNIYKRNTHIIAINDTEQ